MFYQGGNEKGSFMNSILPNDLCPCQSGKKYCECCMLKREIEENEKSRRMFYADCVDASKKASLQYCIHPQKKECSPIIIGAHNIQHNGILSELAENGHVYMPVTDIYKKKLCLKSLGITKQATVFTGFCGKHDKEVFSSIEDYPFTKTKEQLFLYAYKAFAFTYYKILREAKRNEILFDKYNFSSQNLFLCLMEEQKLYKKYIESELENFNICILTQNYDKLHSFIGKLDFEVNFAVSSAFEVQYDLLENKITHFPQAGKLSLIYLTVFPEKPFSYYLISYFNYNDKEYSGLIKQIKSIPRHLLIKYLNNLIILNAENIALSPRLVNHWSEKQNTDFVDAIQTTLENYFNPHYKDNYFTSRSFNIFENI
jgi:hypothetical protein